MTDIQKKEPQYIFETSWEVCNMIGGIYTVLSTKAKTLQKEYKDRIIFIGPNVWKKEPSPYFIAQTPAPLKAWEKTANAAGLPIQIGRWDIPGKPIVVLVDFEKLYSQKDFLYGEMWRLYQVDSLHAYGDYDEGCAFGFASALVIESFYKTMGDPTLEIAAHFNEWTTGMGLLYTKHLLPQVATLFTTHATSIGRSIAGNNKPLYDYLLDYDGDLMAKELNMEAKHSLEKAAAHQADCFTTVSEITAKECTQLLGITPAIVTPNGFEENFIPKGAAFIAQKKDARAQLLQVASSLCNYTPDADTFLIATSGRYEYKNKGIDLLIESLRQLKYDIKPTQDIIAFILVPAWVESPRKDLIKALNNPLGKNTTLENPIITHNLHNFWEDKIVNQLRAAGINNQPEDKVKVIFVPSYLTGNDGIFNNTYYDLLIGFDATAFPSYYEPWGYTPLESIAFGVPTITTDLAGFGLWAKTQGENSLTQHGVEVLHRTDSNYSEIATQLATTINHIASLTTIEKNKIDKAAIKLAKVAEWKNFITYYHRAFSIALQKAAERNKKQQ